MAEEFVPFVKNVKRSSQRLVSENADIKPLEIRNLVAGSVPTYGEIKSRFRKDIDTKSGRFVLSELVADQLSVEEEEQRRFEKKVAEVVEQQISSIRDESIAKGYAEGLDRGRNEAYEKEKARLASHIESLAAAIQSIAKAKQSLGTQYEGALLDMSFKIAKIIVHQEFKDRPAAISGTISDILGRVAKDDDVMIRLSSREFEAIEQIQDDVKSIARSGRISFEVDQRLGSGDCIVESLSGEISSVLEEKFKKLQEEVTRTMRLNEEARVGTGT